MKPGLVWHSGAWRSPRSFGRSGRVCCIPLIASLFTLVTMGSAAAADSARAAPGDASGLRFELRVDAGFLAVLAHDYQKGSDGTNFDYADAGGQDVLFPVSRYELRLQLDGHHRFSVLYQPLALRTRETLAAPLVVDGTTFEAGSSMEFYYGFPFYRAGYAYSFELGERSSLELGGALQIRNATVEFVRLDGSGLSSNRDVGPVPLLHLGARTALGGSCWLELEADGIYAPVKYLNGNDNGVEGAILDANLRFGMVAQEHLDVFVNARWLAGGAEGSSGDGPDSFSSNWLQFFILSVGAAIH
jgi:hypothetical protein